MERRPVLSPRRSLALAVAIAIAAVPGCASYGGGDAREISEAHAAFKRKDYENAARLLADPAAKGDADAQYALGYMYYYGYGVTKDRYRARIWFEHSAALGNLEAMRALSLLRVYSLLPADPNKKTAPSEAVAASEQGPASNTGEKPADVASTGSPGPDATGSETAAAPGSPVSMVSEPPAPVAESATPMTPPASAVLEATPLRETKGADAAPVEPIAPTAMPTLPAAAPATATPPAAAVLESASGREAHRSDAAPVEQTAPAAMPVPEIPVVPVPVPAPANKEGTSGMIGAVAPVVQCIPVNDGNAKASASAESRTPVAEPRYTLNLLSSRKREDLEALVRHHGLESHASFYSVQRVDGVHYRLIYGAYATVAQANAALAELPPALYRSKPWVNNYPAEVKLASYTVSTRMAEVTRR